MIRSAYLSAAQTAVMTVALLLVISVLPAKAASLHLNASNDLEIKDSGEKLVKLLQPGSVATNIKVDSYEFRVSYGRDLNGKTTIIAYPNPRNPQEFEFKIFSELVKVTKNGVVTIRSEGNNSGTVSAGLVGSVTVGSESLVRGQKIQIAGGAVVPRAPDTPVTPIVPEAPGLLPEGDEAPMTADATETAPASADDILALERAEAAAANEGLTVEYVTAYEGAKVREMVGDVLYAAPGKDPIALLQDAIQPPRLVLGQDIEEGATVQTGPNSSATISVFPGGVILLEPNTRVTFTSLTFANNNNNQQREGLLDLSKGGVISTFQGIDPQKLDFKIRTAQGVAAVRGTTFKVKASAGMTIFITEEGEVRVFSEGGDNKFDIIVTAGNQVTVGGGEGVGGNQPFELSKASPAELAAAAALRQAVQNFIQKNDIKPNTISNDDKGALTEAIKTFENTFAPRLNDDPMTPTTPAQ